MKRLLLLFLFITCGISAQINHVTEIKKEVFSEAQNKYLCPELKKYVYKDKEGKLYSESVESVPSSEDYMDDHNRKLNYMRTFYYLSYFRTTSTFSYVKNGTDSLIVSSRKKMSLNSDSLIEYNMEDTYYPKTGKYYSNYKTQFFYYPDFSMKAYETCNVDKKAASWSPFYRCLRDSSETKKTAFVFQSYKDGQYVTKTNQTFDSVLVKNGTFQFIFRSTSKSDDGYDKYVYGVNGNFIAYENWQHYSDQKNFTQNTRYTYKSDVNNRATKGTMTVEMETEGTIEEFYTYTYEKKTGASSVAIDTIKKEGFIFVDWCNDTGKEIEMILVDQNMKINFYGRFPIGQPYFKTSSLPKGKYHLVLFCRSGQIGNMMSIEL